MSKFFTSRILFFIAFYALCVSCQDEETVPNDEIINLRVYNTSHEEITEAIGDGETMITLEVTIPDNANASYSSVTFKKSAGEFIGTTENKIVKPIDHDGKARVDLKLPLNNQPIFVSAEIGSGNNLYIDEETITLVSVDQVIDLKVLNIDGQELTTPVRADGITQLLLKASVLTNTTQLNLITFNTSAGAFLNNNSLQTPKSTNGQHEATVSLKVPRDVAPLYFSSVVGANPQYFDESNLILQRAYADTLIIEPALVKMNLTQGNIIKVFFRRNQGFVSTGTTATLIKAFQIINGVEVSVGRFVGVAAAKTNADGEMTVTFYADTHDITANVPVRVRIKSPKDDGGENESEVVLTVS